VIEVILAAGLSVLVGIAWFFAVRAVPRADPARAASDRVAVGLAEHAGIRRFLRARVDPETATGLTLTLAGFAVFVAAVVLGVFAVMIRRHAGLVSVDVAVTRWAATHATSSSVRVFDAITWAGSTIGIVLVSVATATYALVRWRTWRVLVFFIVVVAGQLLLSNAVKIAVDRVRPNEAPFHVVAGPSFPSGHATAAAATWAAVALVLGRGTSVRVRAVLAGIAAGIAVAVACSRVFLGAHWMSDAIGGLLLGWTWFAICAVAFGGRVLRLGAPIRDATDASSTAARPGTHPASAPARR
jgi:membrane-associated phospholipid phosphatase